VQTQPQGLTRSAACGWAPNAWSDAGYVSYLHNRAVARATLFDKPAEYSGFEDVFFYDPLALPSLLATVLNALVCLLPMLLIEDTQKTIMRVSKIACSVDVGPSSLFKKFSTVW
jgi:hypothetical protein